MLSLNKLRSFRIDKMFNRCRFCHKIIWLNGFDEKFSQMEQDGTIYKDSITHHYHIDCQFKRYLEQITNLTNQVWDLEQIIKKKEFQNRV